jgi:hypothetical protein
MTPNEKPARPVARPSVVAATTERWSLDVLYVEKPLSSGNSGMAADMALLVKLVLRARRA